MTTRSADTLAMLCAILALLLPPREARSQDIEAAPPGIARVIIEAASKYKQPAIAAAVLNSDGPIASAIWGRRSQDPDAKTVQPGDRFHIGSCTKAMTATLAAILVQDGTIRWETTLGELFPDIKGMNEAYRPVMLEQLLHHRGGVPPFTVGNTADFKLLRGLAGDPRRQRAALCEALLTQPPASPVGGFVYSNAGYAIAAAMLEKAADLSYEDMMRERLFTPLGMSSADFGWPATKEHPDQPLGHQLIGEKLMTHPVGFFYRIEPPLSPAGDASMSIEDFARFASFHLAGLKGTPTRGIDLPREAFERLHAIPGGDGPGKDYACGWAIISTPEATVHWHNGSVGTFFAMITIDPRNDRGAVVVTNAGSGEKAAQELTKALLSGEAE